jgi:hypothetical protein
MQAGETCCNVYEVVHVYMLQCIRGETCGSADKVKHVAVVCLVGCGMRYAVNITYFFWGGGGKDEERGY